MSFTCITGERRNSITKRENKKSWNSNGPHAISKALWFYFRWICANTLSLSLPFRHQTKTRTCVRRMSFGNVVTIHWFRSFNVVVAVSTMTMVYCLFYLSPFFVRKNKCVTKCWAADLILVIFSATLIFALNLFVRSTQMWMRTRVCVPGLSICYFFILHFFSSSPAKNIFLLLVPFLVPLIYSNFMAQIQLPLALHACWKWTTRKRIIFVSHKL